MKAHPTNRARQLARRLPPLLAGAFLAVAVGGCATTTSESGSPAGSVSAVAEDAWLPGRAILRAHRNGLVYGSKAGGDWKKLMLGAKLSEGDKAESDATAIGDFFLGMNGPVLRLAPGSVVGFERLRFQTNELGAVIETVMKLEAGRLLGIVKTLQPQSKYEITLPTGVCAIRDRGQYDVSASGQLTVVEGAVAVRKEGLVYTVRAGQTFEAGEKGAEALRRAITR